MIAVMSSGFFFGTAVALAWWIYRLRSKLNDTEAKFDALVALSPGASAVVAPARFTLNQGDTVRLIVGDHIVNVVAETSCKLRFSI
jgi:hypothetical protein